MYNEVSSFFVALYMMSAINARYREVVHCASTLFSPCSKYILINSHAVYRLQRRPNPPQISLQSWYVDGLALDLGLLMLHEPQNGFRLPIHTRAI